MPRLEKNKKTLLPRAAPPAQKKTKKPFPPVPPLNQKKKKKKKKKTEKNYISKNETFWPPKEN